MPSKTPSARDVAIGLRVARLRSARNVPQEKLGAALGVTFQQIQKYEKGKNRIPAGRIQEIAELLDVPVASFFEDDVDAIALKGSWKLPHGNEANSRRQNHALKARVKVAHDIAVTAGKLAGRAHAAGFDTLSRILELAAIEARGYAGD